MSTIQNYKEINSLFQSGLSTLAIEDRLKIIEYKFSESSGESILELDNPYSGMTLNVVWQQGILNGKAAIADQSGKKICEFTYRDFSPSGTCTFSKDNNLLCSMNILNGCYYGTCSFYKDSALLYKGDYFHGDVNGSGTLYYPNGSALYEGNFKYGLADGVGTFHTLDGKTVHSSDWKNGVCTEVTRPISLPTFVICPKQVLSKTAYSMELLAIRYATDGILLGIVVPFRFQRKY